ncbi:hypothetical protein COX22_01900 [Candidatus Falkowbacteria bacterium CG23_combo_of_CG06-09_8_20_14_all_49_15]|uniref:Uncharacterized protein n=1 Tax=Candidatus Falkowbacteria bacterium CG23_combo_of_CG06-09_8_20_14_all_49_15 TaxID=1974572 RepID=A0A2G9ZL75_9BACT|nr:MAG: hypothetical protein COX22_01900 [Candidatus Falkowbacteria bacterium CG23_combo_of_CG06-09_8_20_14_all_49_15]
MISAKGAWISNPPCFWLKTVYPFRFSLKNNNQTPSAEEKYVLEKFPAEKCFCRKERSPSPGKIQN